MTISNPRKLTEEETENLQKVLQRIQNPRDVKPDTLTVRFISDDKEYTMAILYAHPDYLPEAVAFTKFNRSDQVFDPERGQCIALYRVLREFYAQ